MRDYQTVSLCESLMSFTAFRFEPGSSHPISLNKKKEPCYASPVRTREFSSHFLKQKKGALLCKTPFSSGE